MIWQEKIIPRNIYSRPGIKLLEVKKIVEHYTANPGAGAKNHVTYFGETLPKINERLPYVERRFASAHLFIDRYNTFLIIPLDEVAYHANELGKCFISELKASIPGYKGNANLNTIGVELCIEKDGSIHPDTFERAKKVNAELCKMFKLNPEKDIVRHYDITRKKCPAPWVENPNDFVRFKSEVSGLLQTKIEKEIGDMPLQLGDKGEGVKVLHYNLASMGYTQWKNVDIEEFGEWTRDALIRFQKDQKLRQQDGIYDFKTAIAFAQVAEVYRKHWFNTKK